MSEFKKENRYVVLKLSKLNDHQKTALGAALAEINLDESAMPECVVVEHDWQNYQETWEAIQAIVEGRFVSRDALAAKLSEIRKVWDACGGYPDTISEVEELRVAIEGRGV